MQIDFLLFLDISCTQLTYNWHVMTYWYRYIITCRYLQCLCGKLLSPRGGEWRDPGGLTSSTPPRSQSGPKRHLSRSVFHGLPCFLWWCKIRMNQETIQHHIVKWHLYTCFRPARQTRCCNPGRPNGTLWKDSKPSRPQTLHGAWGQGCARKIVDPERSTFAICWAVDDACQKL